MTTKRKRSGSKIENQSQPTNRGRRMITIDDDNDGRGLGLEFDDAMPIAANIKVVGIGGGGGNAINRMVSAGVSGVQFLSANTDCQALKTNRAPVTMQLGAKLTKGLGAGGNP